MYNKYGNVLLTPKNKIKIGITIKPRVLTA